MGAGCLQGVPVEILHRIVASCDYETVRELCGLSFVQSCIASGAYWRGRTLRIASREALQAALLDPNVRTVCSIDASLAGLDDVDLGRLAGHFCRLTHVNLDRNADLTDAGLGSLIRRHGPHLKSLNLTRLFRLTNVTLEMVSEHCALLQRAVLTGCLFSTAGLGRIAVGDEEQRYGQKALPLKSLSLSRCHLIDTEQLLIHLSGMAALRHLDISHLDGLQPYQVEGILEGLPRLESLCVVGCPELTLANVDAFKRRSPRLRVMHDAKLEDHSIDAVRRFLLGLISSSQ